MFDIGVLIQADSLLLPGPEVSAKLTSGFTVMVKISAAPVHPDGEVGVTVIVATIGELPVFVAIKPGISPLPETGKLISG